MDTKKSKPLIDVVKEFQSVNLKVKDAKANETNIEANNGSGIWYNWLWKFGKDAEIKKVKDNRK